MQELFTRAPDGRATEAREVRAEERPAERNACFFKNIKMRILDVKEKKRMEYLAICVITLTMQEFSAYKKHDTAQAGPGVGGVGGGTLSNSYVMGIFLPVAGTFLSRPDVPTRLTQPAMDAGGFLNS